MSAASHTRVVVVDDDDDLRRYISLAVGFDGRFDVVASAGTAHAGIREVAEHRPDAVLVDLTLPDIAGYGELGVVTAMHNLIPRGRVVVFTGRSDEGLEGRVMRAGGTALVTKGADAAAFIGALLASGRFGAGTDVDVRSTFWSCHSTGRGSVASL